MYIYLPNYCRYEYWLRLCRIRKVFIDKISLFRKGVQLEYLKYKQYRGFFYIKNLLTFFHLVQSYELVMLTVYSDMMHQIYVY